MIEFIKNAWYIAGWAREIEPDKLLARTIADTEVVMYRDGTGALCALRDRCAHRFVPLSKGRICNGVLECGYHGLQYNRSGVCVSNPHGPVSRALAVDGFTLTEREGLLWLWLGDPAKARIDGIPDMSASPEHPAAAIVEGYLPVKAHHLLLVDNILDLSHADYLHRGGLGSGGTMTRSRPKIEEGADWLLAEWFVSKEDKGVAIMRAQLPDPKVLVDMWTEVRWHSGSAVMLKVGMVGTGEPRDKGIVSHVIHAMTPESATSSHYFYRVWRNYRQDDEELSRGMREAVRVAFEDEDKMMIELQQRAVGDEDFMSLKPALLPIDAASSRARRLYDKLLQAERSEGPWLRDASA
jgi:phenylpropionate dioxygenase-like ring-hydroxylating dioxygenase large terminal subunit